jgi:hypothetical protein
MSALCYGRLYHNYQLMKWLDESKSFIKHGMRRNWTGIEPRQSGMPSGLLALKDFLFNVFMPVE